jgi:hypothetical protein
MRDKPTRALFEGVVAASGLTPTNNTASPRLIVPLELEIGAGRLRFFRTTITTFGTRSTSHSKRCASKRCTLPTLKPSYASATATHERRYSPVRGMRRPERLSVARTPDNGSPRRCEILLAAFGRDACIVSRRRQIMLWTVALVLLLLWGLGLVSSYTLGGFIHILLVLALVMVVISVINGRRVL